MFGWDVGYVWPLLEGAVVAQVTRTTSYQQIIMGYPRDVLQNQPGSSSPSHPSWPQVPRPQNAVPASNTGPPPYETIPNATLPSQYTVPQVNQDLLRQIHHSDSELEVSNRSRRRSADFRHMNLPRWPHKTSSTFACLSCVLGMYNVSRFSFLVYIYKGSFIIQFLLLSMVIGIPYLYLQMVLGQYLGAGLMNMWYISPAFKGLGFAMLYVYVILGIYNAVPLSWMFVYFKDSFITLKDSYKWGKCHYNFARNECLKALNSSSSDYYGWAVPSYFHGRVLGRRPDEYHFGELKFEVAFNLCLVWLIIFICLSRGPKTLGKVVYILGTLPVALLIMITMRMGQQWGEGIQYLFSPQWKSVFTDSSAWNLAAREVFLTWGLLGSVALQICSHNKMSTNISKTLAAVATTSIIVLIMSAFLFSCSAHVLFSKNLSLTPSSYEEESSVCILKHGSPFYRNFTVSVMVIGESITSKEKFSHASGYQMLRLATEVFPAALAIEGVRSISSFWSICFYTAMIMFGLGQQAVLWYCVVESVIAIHYKVFKAWQTTITFVACNLAFLLGLPLTSNVGIYIIHYFDFCVGMLWWILVIYLVMLFAVLFVRGRPCGTEQLVKMISRNSDTRSWILPFFTFQWNIMLPVALLILAVSFFQSSTMCNSAMSQFLEQYIYWPVWAKTAMVSVQMFPLLTVLVVGAYQLLKVFITKPDLPISERLRDFCCPVLPSASSRQSLRSTSSIGQGSTNSAFINDPPPKYTPPPSYSTATSRMLAKRIQSVSTCSIDTESLEEENIVGGSKHSSRASALQRESSFSRSCELPITDIPLHNT